MSPADASCLPSHAARRVSMLLCVRDHTRHRSLMVELLQRARRAKLAGATVFKAQQGYGESGRVHRARMLADDSPVTIVIVDLPEKIDAFLANLGGLLDDVMVVVQDVDVVEI